jgi:hypothetical protein
MGLGKWFTRVFSRPEQLNVQQRTDVLARMARTNMASATNAHIFERHDTDYQEALARIKVKVGPSFPPYFDAALCAKHIVLLIVKMIQDADFTINFRADQWFRTENTTASYTTMYENMARGIQPNPLNPPQMREQAENRVFRYDAGPQQARSLPPASFKVVRSDIIKYGASGGLQNRGAPAQPTWQAANPTFAGLMRPRYSAVNFGKHKAGAATLYGQSHFVLKAYLRFNSTYSHVDTFDDSANNGNLCCYHNLYKIISACDDDFLDALIRCATQPGATYSSDAEGTRIIEAQIHADVLFNRDVEKMIVSIKEAPLGGPIYHNVKKFAERHRIPVLRFVSV